MQHLKSSADTNTLSPLFRRKRQDSVVKAQAAAAETDEVKNEIRNHQMRHQVSTFIL